MVISADFSININIVIISPSGPGGGPWPRREAAGAAAAAAAGRAGSCPQRQKNTFNSRFLLKKKKNTLFYSPLLSLCLYLSHFLLREYTSSPGEARQRRGRPEGELQPGRDTPPNYNIHYRIQHIKTKPEHPTL